MARILDDFMRFLKDILMNNLWSVLLYTIAHLYSFIHVVVFGSTNSCCFVVELWCNTRDRIRINSLDRSFYSVAKRVFSRILYYLHGFGINTKTSFITLTTGYSYSVLTTISDIYCYILPFKKIKSLNL